MGLTNLIITVAGVSAVILLLRSDVKQSAAVFRRNVKHIRHWLEEESSAASKTVNQLVLMDLKQVLDNDFNEPNRHLFVLDNDYNKPGRHLFITLGWPLFVEGYNIRVLAKAAKEAPPKELESKVPHKDIPKEDKH
ncbi:hypothetical protein DKX38_025244 [Salix brachista]|uniref:Rx N-terminal domain-containing protein n=1 Tax=Salix brachista TaxID=2182728 RepID=A0A5N5JUQ1_9ROSI|nr:hypothetical protein DKX38_025244 [Salix brachista]